MPSSTQICLRQDSFDDRLRLSYKDFRARKVLLVSFNNANYFFFHSYFYKYIPLKKNTP